MKKINLALILICACVLAACSSKKDSALDENGQIIASTPDPAVITQAATTKEVPEFTGLYTFGPATLMCTMPEEFKPSEDMEGEYVSKKYPKDLSSINHIIVESEDDPTLVTKEEYVANLKKEFLDSYGNDIDFIVTQYDKIMVDGRPGLWIIYNYDFRGEHYYVLSVILYNGTESNYLTFMQAPGADWMSTFIDAAETLTYR